MKYNKNPYDLNKVGDYTGKRKISKDVGSILNLRSRADKAHRERVTKLILKQIKSY